MGTVIGYIPELEKQKYACAVCGKEFHSEKKLAEHMKAQHDSGALAPDESKQ